MIWSILYNFFDVIFLSNFISFTFFFPFIYRYISLKSPVSFLWCSCMLYMISFYFAAVSWFYFMFKNNNFLSYCFFDKFVSLWCYFWCWYDFRYFFLRDAISLLRALEHKPWLVKKQFSEVRKKTRAEARQKQNRKENVSDVKFITTYNPALPNINKIIKK